MKDRFLDRLQAILGRVRGTLDGKKPPVGLLVWLALGLALAAVAVLMLGHHTTTSRPAAVAAASRSTTSTTSTTSATTKAPATTTTAPKAKPPPPTPGHPVPYARLGQRVAQRLEATVGGLDVAMTTPDGGSPEITQTFAGDTAFGVDIGTDGGTLTTGTVRVDAVPGGTVAFAAPPGACGVEWATAGTVATNAALPGGSTTVTVIWGDPHFSPGGGVVAGRLVVSLDAGVTFRFASSCPAGPATWPTPFSDPWGSI